MSINDMFRRFFGFPTDRYPDEIHPREEFDAKFPDSENHYEFANDIDDMFHHFEQHFQEVFRNFGFIEFSPPSFPDGFPERGMLPNLPQLEENTPLRERFLKRPDTKQDHNEAGFPAKQQPRQAERPLFKGWLEHGRQDDNHSLQDQDLDIAITKDGLDGLLENHVTEPPARQPAQTFFSSKSIRTILRADGKVEEKCTKTDSFGNEETSVTRQYGDKVHSIITRRSQDGQQEQDERFTNMDEKNLPEFEKKWNTNSCDFSSEHKSIVQQPSTYSGILSRFFKGYF